MPRTLEEIVREYLAEHANPSPDAIMRANLRTEMAKVLGLEDPLVTIRRWHSNNKQTLKNTKG